MVLFTILVLMLAFLLVFGVFIVSAGGAVFVTVFGDVLVCAGFIILICRWLWKRHKGE